VLSLLKDRAAWLHSVKSLLASFIALYIALATNLPRPYWAMATAYIVMQPVMGGTNSRGIYRTLGTWIAAIAVVAIVPNLLQTPVLLSLAISLWLSSCMFVAMLHRGPSSYVFMLAGYTMAFIGFPAVLAPDAIFDTALARAEEIWLGSLCAVVIGAVVFPTSIQPVVLQRINGLMTDAKSWCAQVLAHRGSPDALRRVMAGNLSQLDQVIPFARRDDPRHGDLGDWMLELRTRVLSMMPILAAVEDRLDDLGESAQNDNTLKSLIEDLRAWIERDELPTLEMLSELRARIAALRPAIDGSQDSLLRNSLLLRLSELCVLWYDSRRLQHSIASGQTPPAPTFHLDLRSLVRIQNRHVDWGMLIFSSLAAGATLFAYCLLWIAVGWPDGASGAMLAAVAAAFFAAQDDPAPNIAAFLLWAVVAMVLAGIYLFGIIPAIHDFVPLILTLAPTFLLLGLITYRPKYFLPGMILVTNLATLLSIQNGYVADFTSFVNSSISTIVGLLFALVTTRVFRSVGAEWTARRLIRQGWRLLAAAAQGRGVQNRDMFLMRMLDLLGLLAPRLASLPAESDVTAIDMLDEVRIGLNILNLRRARGQLPKANVTNLNRLLLSVAGHYRAQQRAGHALPPRPALKKRLDLSLSRLGSLPPSEARDESLLGLIGLRQGLFRTSDASKTALNDPRSDHAAPKT